MFCLIVTLICSKDAEQNEQVDVDNPATEKMKTQEEIEGTKEIASNTGYIDENVENDATHVKFMHTSESTDHDHILSSQLSKRNEAKDGHILNMPKTSTEETTIQQIEKTPNNVGFDENGTPLTGSNDTSISYVALKSGNDQVTENDNSMTTTSSVSQESPRYSQQIASFLMPAQRSSGGNPADEQISEKQVIYFVTENPTFLNDQAQPMVESDSTQKTITYLFADNNSKDLKPSDYEIIKASNRDFIAQNQNFHNPNVNSMDNRLQEWMFPNFAEDQAMHTGLHDMFHQTQLNKGSDDILPMSIQTMTTAKSTESSSVNPETFPSSANKPLVDPRVSSISGDANTGNNIFLPELAINSQVNWGDGMQKGSEGLAGLADKSTNEETNEIDIYEDDEAIHDKIDQETLQHYDDKGICIPEKMCPNIKFKGACSLENTTQADKFRPKTKNCCPLTHCVDVHKNLHRTYYIIQAGTIPTEKSEIKRQKGKRTQTTTCSNIKCMNQTEIPNAKSCLKSMNVSPRVAKMLPFLECCGMLKCERKRDSYSVEMKILGTTFYYYETSFYNISEWKDLDSRNNSKILGSARKNSSNPSGPNTLFDFSFPNTHSGQQITPNIGGKLELASQPKKKSKVSKPKSTAKPKSKNNQRKKDDSIEEDSEEEMWKMHKDLHGINDKHHGISKKKPSKAKKDEKRNGQNIAGSKSSKNKNRPLSPPPFENGFAESRSQQDSGLYNDVASMFNGVFG